MQESASSVDCVGGEVASDDLNIKGTLFDIERYSTHDGPGIRTTVFMKGCYLSCEWCHNPESVSPHPELMYDASKCMLDLGCSLACPNDAIRFLDEKRLPIGDDRVPEYAGQPDRITGRVYDADLCRHCGSCVDVCYPKALVMAGRTITAQEAFEEVERDRAFFDRSGGGVTASGGEPLQQQAFLSSLFAQCRAAGIHTALDTTAFRQWNVIADMLPVTDLVLLDLKLMDSDRHKAFTGVANGLILDNARKLAAHYRTAGELGVDKGRSGMWVRVPVIPSINDDEANQAETIRFVKEQMNGAVRAVELLGYHQLGGSKAIRLGRKPPLGTVPAMPKRELSAIRDRWESELAGLGIPVRAR